LFSWLVVTGKYNKPAMRCANQHYVAGLLYRQNSIIQGNSFGAMGFSEAGREKSRPAGGKNTYALSFSYPDLILIVGIDTKNMIIQQGGWIAYGISKNAKGGSIIPVQPVIGAKPHKTIMVLVNTGYGIV